jgi:hypothetical protein
VDVDARGGFFMLSLTQFLVEAKQEDEVVRRREDDERM